MKITSILSGAGGLDIGFTKVGFKKGFVNENNPTFWSTISHNFFFSQTCTRGRYEVNHGALLINL
jgi:site-specific DNA-cytosine methylase